MEFNTRNAESGTLNPERLGLNAIDKQNNVACMWENWPARRLPEVDIAGTKFFLDLRLWECREVEDFSNKFSLDNLYEHGRGFIFCFDGKSKNLFNGSRQEFDKRKHELSVIRWPSLQKLDPVGYRALLGLPPKKEKHSLMPKKRNKPSKGKRI